MPKLLIVFDSQTGNTEKIAKAIAEGAASKDKVTVVVKKIGDSFSLHELADADAIVFGSPTHYSVPSTRMESFLRRLEEVKIDLSGKFGAVFCSYSYMRLKVVYLPPPTFALAVMPLHEFLKSVGMKAVVLALRIRDGDIEKDLPVCREWGRKIAEKLITGFAHFL